MADLCLGQVLFLESCLVVVDRIQVSDIKGESLETESHEGWAVGLTGWNYVGLTPSPMGLSPMGLGGADVFSEVVAELDGEALG